MDDWKSIGELSERIAMRLGRRGIKARVPEAFLSVEAPAHFRLEPLSGDRKCIEVFRVRRATRLLFIGKGHAHPQGAPIESLSIGTPPLAPREAPAGKLFIVKQDDWAGSPHAWIAVSDGCEIIALFRRYSDAEWVCRIALPTAETNHSA